MNINFGPRGILQLDNVRITHRNFEGRASKYNREGDRNFSVIIPNQFIIDICDDPDIPDGVTVADYLADLGWNLKKKPPREEGESEFIFLPVKINMNGRTNVYLQSGRKMVKLDEDTIDIIDNLDIEECDLDIRPYDWHVNGKEGRAAYLQSMKVVQRVDRFSEEFDDLNDILE